MTPGRRLHRASVLFICIVLSDLQTTWAQYLPNWASLDTRPLPEWFDEGKLGIFINWGVYSVPSFGQRGVGNGGASEWFWDWWKSGSPAYVQFMKENYLPGFTYGDFGNEFKAEFFDPNEWAGLFKGSGARYVVFSSKHHDGFTSWPSKFSWNWNSMDVGPKRDLVGDFAAAIRSHTDLHFGIYHSLFEWFHPLYLQDKKNNFTTQDFVATKTMPELYEIVNAYKPDLIWSDGEWEASSTYWNSTEFFAWLYNDSPVKDTVVTNDRWGKEVRCHHGGYFTCQDRYDPGIIHTRKWETGVTIDRDSWGFRRNAELSDYLLPEDLVHTFVVTVSTGGNMLMNVGPKADGTIAPIFQERLQQMGQWLAVNGEAIYGTKPWVFQNDTVTPDVWYTSKWPVVYAITLKWPTSNTLHLSNPVPTPQTNISLLGYPGAFTWTRGSIEGIDIKIPVIAFNKMPCQWAWVFKLEGLAF